MRRTLAHLRATPPRRLLLPAGGVAVAAVAIATALIATTQGGNHRQLISEPNATRSSTAQPPPVARPNSAESGSGEVQLSEAPVPSSSTAESGPYASHHEGRDIERGASMTLAARPSEIRSAAGQVFEAVHAADGIVLHSTIRNGSAGHAGADFDLLIPTARLGDAMAAFSGIAEVRARHESSADITAPTVSAQERLQDSSARVKSLLAQLASAETDAERAKLEVELRAGRAHMANLRSQVFDLHRRANFSHVSLRIETGAKGANESGGGWGIGNGFDDAGRILAIAAGVAIIGLASLAPLAILALLAWLARGAYVRRARAQALG